MNAITPASTETPRTSTTPRAKTMTAVVKTAAGPGIEIRDVPVPSAGAGQLLLKVLRAGVCGTDLHIYTWDPWSQGRIKPPVTMGHEFVGEIVELGTGVTEFKLGERVSCESHIVCEHCSACRTGAGHVCENTRILGVDVNGGFAEYAVAPAVNAWRAPANVPLEVAHQASQQEVKLEVVADPGLADVDVDPQRMREVFTNILDNALRYTPSGGRIILSAEHAGDSVEFKVQDSGPGLPAEELDRIFDRFHRVQTARSREEGGSGLGLAIAKSIVERHRCTIAAESREGQGLAIILRLPPAPKAGSADIDPVP